MPASSAISVSLTLMNAKAFSQTGLARGITPEPSAVLFLPASAAAAERYQRRRRPDRRFFGRSDADDGRRREGGGGEDLLTSVRPLIEDRPLLRFSSHSVLCSSSVRRSPH